MKSRKFTVSPRKVLRKANTRDLQEVVVIRVTSDGAVDVASSTGTPITLTLLNAARVIAGNL